MKKILILSFSGTGNTDYITQLVSKGLREANCVVNIIKMEKEMELLHFDENEKYDLIGIGSPTHAFGCPNIVYEFVENKLPRVDSDGFIYRTAGDPFFNGGSTKKLKRILKEKGINTKFEELFIMPANVFMKFPPELVKQLYLLAQKQAKIFVDNISNENEQIIKYGFLNSLISRVFNALESKGAKKFAKKIKVNQDCNLCELCVKSCPTSNISIVSNKITFGNKCEFCMKCIYLCPKDALENKFFSFFILKDGYSQKENKSLLNNPEIDSNYLNKDTRGFFKHYYKYYKKKGLI